MSPSEYASVRDAANALVRQPTIDDDEREDMISAKAAQALAYAGRDPALARAAIADHALLVKGRSAAAVERLERARGLR